MNYVILCGGSGSRLWPLSREKLPKQLLPIVNANTMLQNTVLRCKNLEMVNKITVICNIEHAFLVEKQLKGLTTIPVYIVTEPIGRDTAAAVAIASLLNIKLLLIITIRTSLSLKLSGSFITLISGFLMLHFMAMSLIKLNKISEVL